MKFSSNGENDRLVRRMENSVREGRVSHAYIFEGPASADKIGFAKSFVRCILCPKCLGENCGDCSICSKIDHDNHEDVMCICREGNSIKDAAIVHVQEKLNVKPLGEKNIIIINDCDRMTLRAQNRLLKTLEEPPADSIIILLSENIENLTQTILSRCVKFRLEDSTPREENSKADMLVNMAVSGESFYRMIKTAGDDLKHRESVLELLDGMERSYRKMISDNEKDRSVQLYTFDDISGNVHEIENARTMILKGMSPGYAFKNLLLRIS